MRRQNARPDDCLMEHVGIVLKGRDCIRVKQRWPTGRKHREQPDAGILSYSCTGPNQQCRDTTITKQVGKIFLRHEGVDHDAGQCRSVD